MKDEGIEITYNSFTDSMTNSEFCPCCGADLSKTDYHKRDYIKVDSWLFGCFSTEYTFSKYVCNTCNSTWINWSKGRTRTNKYAKNTLIFTIILAICVTLLIQYCINNQWIFAVTQTEEITAKQHLIIVTVAFLCVLFGVLLFVDILMCVSYLSFKLCRKSPKKLIKEL